MKNFFKQVIVLLSLLSFGLIAGDNYNQQTFVQESEKRLIYRVSFTMTDSTGNYYSKRMYIGDANVNDGHIQIVQTNEAGTEDVDYTLQFSYDGKTFTSSSADDELTQVGTSTVSDTLGIVDGSNDNNFHNFPFMRLKADGQSGNPQTTVTVYVNLRKDGDDDSGQAVRD